MRVTVTHLRRPLALALALNSLVVVVEFVAGGLTNSFSLLADGVHNLSDETALAALLIAYVLLRPASTRWLGVANILNTVGLVLLSGFVVWQAVLRLLQSSPIGASGTVIAGVLAVLGNLAVARFLRAAAAEDPSIRLAYIHNLGDAVVSGGPIAAGAVVALTGLVVADLAVAVAIGAWFVGTTLRAAWKMK